jgi:hypothetical protein
MKLAYTILLFAVILFLCNTSKAHCNGINNYQNVDSLSADSLTKDILKNGFYIEKSLPANYVKDASVDYTKYIQAALKAHKKVVFPSFPLLINDEGIQVTDNSQWLFVKGAVLKLKPTNKTHYQIVQIKNAANVILLNPNIDGDRANHLSKEGVWGFGLSIISSSDVRLYNVVLKNCWGDGLYIGQANKVPSKNIYVYNVFCDSNRRNGITITSGINIYINNAISQNSQGALPMAGIDIEPNDSTNKLDNIVLNNPVTKNNSGKGIQIGIIKMTRLNSNYVSISILNHYDIGSPIGILIASKKPYVIKRQTVAKFLGHINIQNPIWEDNDDSQFRALSLDEIAPNITIQNPVIKRKGKALSNAQIHELIQGKTNLKEKVLIN